jgi:glycosyltransferase involved in cell wall biosynthesis
VKICFVLEHYYPHVGGVETEFLEFSRRLVSLGCEVRVITSDSGGVSGHQIHENVETWHHPWKGLFGHPCPRAKDIEEHVVWADIVHTTTYTAAPVAVKVARRLNKPCVISVQEALGKRWFSIGENVITASLFYLFERFVITRPFNAWHCISQATARDVSDLGISSAKIKPILLGVDDSLYNNPPPRLNPAELFGVDPGTKVILFFGRPGKTKGVNILFNAIKSIKDEIPSDVLFGFILGAHPPGERQRYCELLTKEQLSQNLRIVPSVPRDQLLGYVQGAYCVVVPSITEGFGFSAAETCALGTPIISSDGGSLPEVVSGRHLFFRNQSSEDLATRLRAAFKGEFQRTEKRYFSWSESALKLKRLYEEMCSLKSAD